MDEYKLSRSQRLAYEQMHSLDAEDLYVILGGVATVPSPTRRGDSLGFRIVYERGKAAVKKGQRRLEEITETCRGPICETWNRVKKDYNRKLRGAEAAGIVYHVLRHALGQGLESELLAATDLILRVCEFSLDTFCAGHTPPPKSTGPK